MDARQFSPGGQELSTSLLAGLFDRLVSSHVSKLKELHDLKYTSQQQKESLVSEVDSLLNGLIDILDSFDQMIKTIDGAVSREDKKARRILKNFSTIRKKFSVLLKRSNITTINGSSGEFIAGLHKAVGVEASISVPEGNIIRMEKAGYFWNNSILRPADVVVSSGGEESAPETGEAVFENEDIK